MFLVNFVNRIQEMARIEKIAYGERDYTSRPIHAVDDPAPVTLKINTLTGLVDYLKADVDGIVLKGEAPVGEGLLIHVSDFRTVSLFSGLSGNWRVRESYVQASADSFQFGFGNFYDVESFIIALQSQFVPDETTAAILKIVGNVSESAVRTFADDGVTQQVTAKAGVSRVEDVAVPNPVILRPFRTFLEIEQPASRFVFRMRSGRGEGAPSCALFEADGGTWKNDAIKKVRDWLFERLPDIPIIA